MLKAIVQKVIRDGNHGPYAVSTSEDFDQGSITFSLEPTVWKEEDYPESGSVVLLAEIRQKRAGWRAKMARYWKPSDEQTEKSTFLYPKSRQFPFDETCEQIVRELEKRNWSMPGITIEFSDYGSGEQHLSYVRKISGDDFSLHFCRQQGSLPGDRYNDIAAVSTIVIPKKELSVYEDESGPSLNLYVGKNWNADKERFINSSKVNSKLNGELRTYLKYSGACNCRSTNGAAFGADLLLGAIMRDSRNPIEFKHIHTGQRSPLLVHNHDLHREYDPVKKEPTFFVTSEVMTEFDVYLKKNVLKRILATPVATEKVFSKEIELLPFPHGVFPHGFFCFAEYNDVRRITQGKNNKNDLRAADRYGMQGTGLRLMAFSTKNDGTVDELAYDGFLWCGILPNSAIPTREQLKINGGRERRDENFVIKIIPRHSNGIYVVDHAPYERRRLEIWAAIEASGDTREKLVPDEVADFICARARTLVAINDYKGGYEEPVILINRELQFDEVEIIGQTKQVQY